jgi:hypothetical protein
LSELFDCDVKDKIMKITWSEVKKNIRTVNHESPGAYEHEYQLTDDYEFEFNLDANDIDYYLLSEGTIKAVTRSYSMKEMFDMGISNWDGKESWRDEADYNPNLNKMRLPTEYEYAAMFADKENK